MSTDRESLTKKMKDMFGRAEKARTDGKRDLARTFRSGARRLQRQIKALGKPVAAEGAEKTEPAAS